MRNRTTLFLDNEGNMLSDKPEGYNSDINAYKGWLREGIDRFKKRNNLQ